MKNYAIANVIAIIVGFLTTIIMIVAVFIPLMNVTTESDVFAIVYVMIPIIAIFGILGFGTGVFVLVRYFQYISALKSASDDQNLQRAYRLELWGFILGLVFPVVLVFVSIRVMIPLFNYLYSGMGPSYTYEEMYTTMILPIMGIFLLLSLGSLTIVVLKIVAKFAIDTWAVGISNAYSGNPYAIELQQGTNLMKWGVVVQLFFGTIGSILFIVGLFRAGKNAILLFSAPPAMAPTGTQPPPYSGYGTEPNFQSYYQPNVSGPTVRPSTSGAGSSTCPACGAILPDPNMRFCTNCGRAL